ncbi:hypothetical protein PHYBLDRAFT_166209 [Phycomyces blakesleeanus NRRL 1555(-)]|uniref:Uncharacterized protein n=1 Tax=Phycomyces blakesleeanus (strain ATCC 8743b / DSM 1359 / FGSC 10004 / NBRC 33097 / NRRL 1555) TaxID=763407 RepID=A0A162XQW1_PHYB8|nr:hypothetical protein PHYBLDRAFT_166209 [Phycomyces blakesleeanus NRRL 1555(-)]OAD76235.1 hypothetical protein PHYBLDRAFT_166209 [Phycomyces blakesleeanus NRRL 1555(-)]|eukprot:XP_018294275.1 hypothetical protein PHYBLDRAFT_166209 [Phycomyces blakesleeanus NRRL 1555(-)]
MYPEGQLSPSVPNSPRYTLPPITSPTSRQNMHPPQPQFNQNNIHHRPMDREPDQPNLYKQHTPQFAASSSVSSTFVQMLAYNNTHPTYTSTVQNTYSYHPYHEYPSYGAPHETSHQVGENEKAHVAAPWPAQYRTNSSSNNVVYGQPSSVSISTRSPIQIATPEEIHQYTYTNLPKENNSRNSSNTRWQEGEIVQVTENARTKKEREYNERVQEIEREFMENKRMKRWKKSRKNSMRCTMARDYALFDERLAALEDNRVLMIKNAQLMMDYQVKCVDKQHDTDWRTLEKESMAEKRELQRAMYVMLEEKRKKLKEDKDGELGSSKELAYSTHHTRNRKRMMRKRGNPLLKLDSIPPTKTGNYTSKRRYAAEHILFNIVITANSSAPDLKKERKT